MNRMDFAFQDKVCDLVYGPVSSNKKERKANRDERRWQMKGIELIMAKKGIDGVMDEYINPHVIDVKNLLYTKGVFNDIFMELMAEFGGYIYHKSKDAYRVMAFIAMHRVRRATAVKGYQVDILPYDYRYWAESLLDNNDRHIRLNATPACNDFFNNNIKRCLKDEKLRLLALDTIFEFSDDMRVKYHFVDELPIWNLIKENEVAVFNLVTAENWKSHIKLINRHLLRLCGTDKAEVLCKKFGFTGFSHRKQRKEIYDFFNAA